MRCEKCKKNIATVHMEQSSQGVKKDLYLCEECSGDMELTALLENIFKGLLNKIHFVPVSALKSMPASDSNLICHECHISFEDIKKGGYLGCSTCYQVFAGVFKPFFEASQGSSGHEGKFPKRGGANLEKENQIHKLRFLMSQSVKEEDFETAALLRDQIRSLSALLVDEE